MAADIDVFRLNDLVISAKSASTLVEEVPYAGILTVDYGDKFDGADLVHNRQKNGAPVGSTYGEYAVDGFKFTVLKDTWAFKMLPQMLALALINGGVGYGAARFTFVTQWQEGVIVSTDTLTGCRILGTKDTVAEGGGKAVVEVTCLALILLRNGFGLFDPTRLP